MNKRTAAFVLDKERLCITMNGGYDIDLENCQTSAEVLDWICQLAEKEWISDEDLGTFVRLLNSTLRPQANLCSFGHSTRMSKAKIREMVRGKH